MPSFRMPWIFLVIYFSIFIEPCMFLNADTWSDTVLFHSVTQVINTYVTRRSVTVSSPHLCLGCPLLWAGVRRLGINQAGSTVRLVTSVYRLHYNYSRWVDVYSAVHLNFHGNFIQIYQY